MPVFSLLLRVTLMLGLLLNGLNYAVAGIWMPGSSDSHAMADTAPCHDGMMMHPGMADAGSPQAATPADTAPGDDSAHCKIKDCLRNCSQPAPLLLVLTLPAPLPAPSLLPASRLHHDLPAPPLAQITRPPIA